MQTDQRVRSHIDAGGVRTYYECEGDGPPVVLLHGGACTIETWGPQWAALASRYRVYAPERRGHGRTPDIAGPITYEAMADDTIAFMAAMKLASAHVIGWSDGALVGLLVAMKRPELVTKLGYLSQPLNFAGLTPKFREMSQHLTRHHLPPQLERAYAAVSPDGPDHWPVVADKLVELWRRDPEIALTSLASVTIPVLVVVGDDDLHAVPHAVDMQRAFPAARLAVVPGASHALAMEKPEIVNPILLDFLAADPRAKLFAAG